MLTWTMYTQAAHFEVQTQPTFIVETEYISYPPDHGEGTGKAEEGIVMKQGDHALRRQLWSVSLGGGTGFGIIGNINDAVNDPLDSLNDPTLKYVVYCKSFFTSRRWVRLAPDYAHPFLTSHTFTTPFIIRLLSPQRSPATAVSARFIIPASAATPLSWRSTCRRSEARRDFKCVLV